jgi:hypothetical protein
MKRKHLLIVLMALFYVSACGNNRNSATGDANRAAQSDPDRGQAVLQMGGGRVSVEYGRPALKGRDLEKLISPGQEWRMGANAPTTLTTDVDLKFGEKIVPQGKYILKAKLDDQQAWRLLFQSEDQKPVAEIPLSFQKVDESTEIMTIELVEKGNGGSFILKWGNLMLFADFQKA